MPPAAACPLSTFPVAQDCSASEAHHSAARRGKRQLSEGRTEEDSAAPAKKTSVALFHGSWRGLTVHNAKLLSVGHCASAEACDSPSWHQRFAALVGHGVVHRAACAVPCRLDAMTLPFCCTGGGAPLRIR